MTTPQANVNTNAAATEDLISIQLNLEEEMTQRGAERYIRNVASQ